MFSYFLCFFSAECTDQLCPPPPDYVLYPENEKNAFVPNVMWVKHHMSNFNHGCEIYLCPGLEMEESKGKPGGKFQGMEVPLLNIYIIAPKPYGNVIYKYKFTLHIVKK